MSGDGRREELAYFCVKGGGVGGGEGLNVWVLFLFFSFLLGGFYSWEKGGRERGRRWKEEDEEEGEGLEGQSRPSLYLSRLRESLRKR